MNTLDTLLAYSEWLDTETQPVTRATVLDALTGKTVTGSGGQRLYVDAATANVIADVLLPNEDDRTHEDLARQFIEHWESNHQRATLAGRPAPGGERVDLPYHSGCGRFHRTGAPCPSSDV